MIVRSFILVAIVAILVANVATSRAHAFCRLTTVNATQTNPCPLDGVPLEWRRPCISYSIDERGSSDLSMEEVQGAIADAFATWLDVDCEGTPLGFQIMEGEENSTCLEAQFVNGGRNVNTFAFIDDWDERGYDPMAFALTTVSHNRSTGEILDADMQINEQQGPFDICPLPSCSGGDVPDAVDLPNVLTHEIGHFLGLGHSTFMPAAMFRSSFRGETSKRFLTSDDIEGICSIYPAGAPEGTCDFTPVGGLDLNCEDADNGVSGCRVHSARENEPFFGVVAGVALALLAIRRRS